MGFIKKLQGLPDGGKKAIIIAIVIVLGLALGGGWLLSTTNRISGMGNFFQSMNLPSIELPKEVTDAINTQAPPSDTTNTSDWKTYTNTEFGFELKYPDNFFDLGNGPKIESTGTDSMPGTSDPVTIESILYHHYDVGENPSTGYFYDYYQVERNGINLVVKLETPIAKVDVRQKTLEKITSTFTFTK